MARATMAVMAAAADGDLTGNWSWTMWLLIPLALLLAFVTARCAGPTGDPPRSTTSSRGVSAYLDQQLAQRRVDDA